VTRGTPETRNCRATTKLDSGAHAKEEETKTEKNQIKKIKIKSSTFMNFPPRSINIRGNINVAHLGIHHLIYC